MTNPHFVALESKLQELALTNPIIYNSLTAQEVYGLTLEQALLMMVIGLAEQNDNLSQKHMRLVEQMPFTETVVLPYLPKPKRPHGALGWIVRAG